MKSLHIAGIAATAILLPLSGCNGLNGIDSAPAASTQSAAASADVASALLDYDMYKINAYDSAVKIKDSSDSKTKAIGEPLYNELRQNYITLADYLIDNVANGKAVPKSPAADKKLSDMQSTMKGDLVKLHELAFGKQTWAASTGIGWDAVIKGIFDGAISIWKAVMERNDANRSDYVKTLRARLVLPTWNDVGQAKEKLEADAAKAGKALDAKKAVSPAPSDAVVK